MKTSKELKELRAAKIKEQQSIVDAATKEKRDLSEDENTQLDNLQKETDDLKKQIERSEKFELNQREAAAVAGTPLGDGEAKEKASVEKRFSLFTAFRNAADMTGLQGAEKEVNEIALQEARNAGVPAPSAKPNSFNIPHSMLRADAHTVTEDAGAYGGKLVHSMPGKIVDPFLPMLTLEEMGASVLTGLTGNYPLIDSGAFAFASATETEKVAAQKVAYTDRIGKPTRASAVTLLSNLLLQQSSYNVEADVRKKIGIAANRKLFVDAINGSGTNEPTGLLNEAALLVSAAVAGVPDWAGITELEGLIDDADATAFSRGYLSDAKLIALMKTIKKDAGSGRFLIGDDKLLNAEKIYKHSDVPTLDAGVSHPLIFGDWSQMNVMLWAGFEIIVDALSAQDQNSIKMVINMHRDCKASNPKAFAARKNFTLS